MALQETLRMRERSAPRFTLGSCVSVRGTTTSGTVVDYWQERGGLHAYTVRHEQDHRLRDYLQDELEAV